MGDSSEEAVKWPIKINSSLETGNNPSLYSATKYWGGKTSLVWSKYIETYSKPGEIVLDPFCGQGIAVGEAVRLGRRAIGFDLQPSSIFITSQIFNKVQSSEIEKNLIELYDKIGKEIMRLYLTRNRSANTEYEFSELSIKDLKSYLNKRGLSTSGKKNQLVEISRKFNSAKTDEERYELIENRGLKNLLKERNLEIKGDRDEMIAMLKQNGYKHPKPEEYPAYVPAIAFLEEGSKKQDAKYTRVRYFDGLSNKDVEIEQADIAHVNNLSSNITFFTKKGDLRYPFPDRLLQYPSGTKFLEGRGFTSLADWYSDRNIAALSALNYHIQSITDQSIRNAFLHAFISIVWQCSRIPPDRMKSKRGYSATVNLMSYYVPPESHMEMNVWKQFESKVMFGRDTIIEAHEAKPDEWNSDIITEEFDEISSKEEGKLGDKLAMIRQGDCKELLSQLPDDCVDFILTDPPYGGQVQYGELELSRSTWLVEKEYKLVENTLSHEIIENNRQNKSSDDYFESMRDFFSHCSRVLKPERYLVLTFTHTGLKYRNMIYRAAGLAGLQVERITWQEPPRKSSRATWDEGIALDGDYYIRFVNKYDASQKDGNVAEIENQLYEEYVSRVAIETIVHNGVPTTLTSLLSRVDGIVTKRIMDDTGKFPPMATRELIEIISENKDIKRLEGDEGPRFWLTYPRAYRMELPLNGRIADLIALAVQKEPKTYSKIHEFIMTSIRDELTPTRKDIVETLREICFLEDGLWRKKPEVIELERAHEKMVFYLGELCRKIKGRYVAIAQDELGKEYKGERLDAQLELSPHPSNYPPETEGSIRRIDVLWMDKDSNITHSFEVENSTRIEGGIMRMADVKEIAHKTKKVKRIIVVPDNRFDEARKIAQSPMLTAWLTTSTHYLLRYSVLEKFFTENIDESNIKLSEIDKILEDMVSQKRLDDFTQ